MENKLKFCTACHTVNPSDANKCRECRSNLTLYNYEFVSDLKSQRIKILKYSKMIWFLFIFALILIIFGRCAYSRYSPNFLIDKPLSSISVLTTSNNWPMYHRDLSHSASVISNSEIPKGILKWKYFADSKIFSSPVIEGKNLYVSTWDGRILSLNIDNGKLNWEKDLESPIYSTISIVENQLIVGLSLGKIVSVNKLDGSLIWQYDLGGTILSSPAVSNGIVYIGSGNGLMYAIDVVNGRKIWTFDTGGWISSSPAVYKDVVGIISYNHGLYILDKNTGRKRFTFRIDGEPSGSAVFGENLVFLPNTSGGIKAVDWNSINLPGDGFILRFKSQLFLLGLTNSIPHQRGFVWAASAGGGYYTTPALYENKVYAAGYSGNLIKVDEKTGNKDWEYSLKSLNLSSPLIAGSIVYIGDASGDLHAVDINTGKNIWVFNTEGQIKASPSYSVGVVYLTSEDGFIYAIE